LQKFALQARKPISIESIEMLVNSRRTDSQESYLKHQTDENEPKEQDQSREQKSHHEREEKSSENRQEH
jgi:hypothetical protein